MGHKSPVYQSLVKSIRLFLSITVRPAPRALTPSCVWAAWPRPPGSWRGSRCLVPPRGASSGQKGQKEQDPPSCLAGRRGRQRWCWGNRLRAAALPLAGAPRGALICAAQKRGGSCARSNAIVFSILPASLSLASTLPATSRSRPECY